jgi:hypothetical protein
VLEIPTARFADIVQWLANSSIKYSLIVTEHDGTTSIYMEPQHYAEVRFVNVPDANAVLVLPLMARKIIFDGPMTATRYEEIRGQLGADYKVTFIAHRSPVNQERHHSLWFWRGPVSGLTLCACCCDTIAKESWLASVREARSVDLVDGTRRWSNLDAILTAIAYDNPLARVCVNHIDGRWYEQHRAARMLVNIIHYWSSDVRHWVNSPGVKLGVALLSSHGRVGLKAPVRQLPVDLLRRVLSNLFSSTT